MKGVSTAREQAYQLASGIMGIVQVAWPIVGPILLMLIVVRFFRWSNRMARGSGTLDDAREDFDDARAMLHASSQAARYREGGRSGYMQRRDGAYQEARQGRRFRW